MTIIQAHPLKTYGVSGPASALDNEVPVFDGVTGKKIKAGSGVMNPSVGRLDLSEIRAKDGNGLKLYEDGGVGIFVEDGGNVGVGTSNPLGLFHVKDYFCTEDPGNLDIINPGYASSWYTFYLGSAANRLRCGQTFELKHSGTVNTIKAKFRRYGTLTGQTVWAEIWTVDANHLPVAQVGDDSVVVDVSGVDTSSTGTELTFTFTTPIPTDADTEYAILINYSWAAGGNYLRIVTGAAYPYGIGLKETAAGNWTTYSTDMGFILNGNFLRYINLDGDKALYTGFKIGVDGFSGGDVTWYTPTFGSRFHWDGAVGAFMAGISTGIEWDTPGASSANFGENNTASGGQAFVAGKNNTVSGVRACAIGSGNTASASSSVAAGYNNTASGSYSIAMGYNNTASGAYSAAMGNANKALGLQSVAMGYKNEMHTPNGVAMGYRNRVLNTTMNQSAMTFGSYLVNPHSASILFGFGQQGLHHARNGATLALLKQKAYFGGGACVEGNKTTFTGAAGDYLKLVIDGTVYDNIDLTTATSMTDVKTAINTVVGTDVSDINEEDFLFIWSPTFDINSQVEIHDGSNATQAVAYRIQGTERERTDYGNGTQVQVSDMMLDDTNMVTNGGFAGNANGWTTTANWAYDSNDVKHTAGAIGELSQDIGSTAGRYYLVYFIVKAFTAGSITVSVGGGTPSTLIYETESNSTYDYMYIRVKAGSADTKLYINASVDAVLDLDNIVCYEYLPCSHKVDGELTVEDLVVTDKYFMAYDSAGDITLAQGTWTALTWDTEKRKDNLYTHSADSASITLGKSGDYKITVDVSTYITVGSSRSVSKFRILNNGTEIDGTRGHMYNRLSSRSLSTGSVTFVFTAVADDVITVEADKVGSDTVKTIPDGCRIMLEKI